MLRAAISTKPDTDHCMHTHRKTQYQRRREHARENVSTTHCEYVLGCDFLRLCPQNSLAQRVHHPYLGTRRLPSQWSLEPSHRSSADTQHTSAPQIMMISIDHIANNDVHRRAPHTYTQLIPQTFAYYSEQSASSLPD